MSPGARAKPHPGRSQLARGGGKTRGEDRDRSPTEGDRGPSAVPSSRAPTSVKNSQPAQMGTIPVSTLSLLVETPPSEEASSGSGRGGQLG